MGWQQDRGQENRPLAQKNRNKTQNRPLSCGTFKSGYQSMKYHYNKHVIKEGFSKGNNILKYTHDAVNFANRNSSVLKYTYNFKYGNASWNSAYTAGQGGMFTSVGKIITFWYGGNV
jgi:hypothetical protein